ncbi:MAG: hypothetical protein FWG37_01480 [Clostridia bacterium]|nr:hypothetical protein [Clostridia bacterium]
MTIWWESLSMLERIFAYVAIPSTVLLFVQTILLMVGMAGQSEDVDVPSDTSGFEDGGADDIETDPGGFTQTTGADMGLRVFTVRGLVAFFSVGGWTGLVMLRGQVHSLLSSIVAVLAGLAAMIALAALLRLALKLQSDGSMDAGNAIGATATVYLPIPAARGARGKVTLMLQEQFRELNAVTDDEAALKTGDIVRVTDLVGNDTLLVTKAPHPGTVIGHGGAAER